MKDSEAAFFTRPAPSEISSAWTDLFTDPLLSLQNLKAVAAAGLGAPDDDGGITLRSVYWRFYLGLLPPPTSLDLFPPALSTERKVYDELRARFLVAPDGRWAADCSGGEGYAPSSTKAGSSDGGAGWDPLSLDGDSPWKTWFAHLDLRATIRQDVDRTFPDIPYFGIERVRRSLTTMLFLFSVLNPDVGYRQGMHELLAACMLVTDRDSLDISTPVPSSTTSGRVVSPQISAAMQATLDRNYVEHDAFGLFQQLMRPAKAFYEWRAEEGPASRAIIGAPQAPIIERCNHIHTQLLRRIDPQLWERLETEGVEAQIWAIRWIRLILTRELPFHLALRLWDGMFAEDPSLGILDFVCVAMLLLIRNELIEGDYPTLLTHLLHYPAPSDEYPFNPALILAQANFLRNDISPAAGVEVVLQNQELLGIKANPPEKPTGIDIDTSNWRGGRGTPPTSRPGSAARGKGKGSVSGIAAGLFERAQKAGLDKAIADFRSNLPDAATAYSFLPSFSPTPPSRGNSPFSTIPSSTASLPPRPPPLPIASAESSASTKTLLDAERQMAEVQLVMVTMGKAMGEWMDTIRDPESGPLAIAQAWSGVERIRDSLLEAPGRDIDDMVKDWAWNDDLDSSRSRASSSAGPTPVNETSPLPSVKPNLPQTPTRAAFLQPDNETVLLETPKAPLRAQMGSPVFPAAPPPVPAPAPAPAPASLPKSPSPLASPPVTARPPGTGTGTGGPSSSKPTLYLSARNDRPAPALSRVPVPIQSPRTAYPPSSGGLLSPALPAASSSARSSPALSPPPLRSTSASASASRMSPPMSSSISSPPIGSVISSASASTTASPGAPASSGAMDPLAGLGVGSITTVGGGHGHERRRSAWRVSTPPSGGRGGHGTGSGSASASRSVSASQPVGVDPLGAV